MFGGTGTVAVVAYKTGRCFVHIDISPKYCEIAAKRLELARAEQELPFSVSRTGRQVKGTFLFAGATKLNSRKKAKKLKQAQLLEPTEVYELEE